jgi:two-component system CheB/CheR fusion protein
MKEMENDDCFVIGVGGSAGGAEAMFELFAKLPTDLNAAYVIVRHLKREFPTQMSSLLQRYTSMETIDIKGGEIVEAGKIYIMPANRKLIIRKRSLYLKSRPRAEIINDAINTFFISLGEEVKEKAVGIVLSGTGQDGIKGVKVIEDNGGIVIVQDPSDARFHQLPQNTIHLDHPDHVVPVAAMPDIIRQRTGQRENRRQSNSSN